MSNERWPLPETWSWVRSADIAKIAGGGTPRADDERNFAEDGIKWITPADLTGYSDVYIGSGRRDLSEQGLSSSGATLLPKGTVLFSSRAPVGYCAIAANEISTNQGFKSLVLEDEILPEYVRHYLLSAKEYAESLASGTTFLELSGKRMAELKIPLAPVSEQKRIVRKLDTLSARTSSTRADLTAIANLVERYRNSVLEIAFKGALTAEWRAICEIGSSASAETKKRLERQRSALSKKNEKPRRPRTAKADHHRAPVELPMPEDWALTTMEDISSPLRLIQYGILKPGPDEAGGVPYVKVMNIKGGVVEPEKIRHTTKEIHQQYMRSSLKTGDLLLTIRGTVGRMAFVPESLDGGNITQDTVRIDLLDGMNSNFVFWYFHSPQAQKYFQENQKGVAVRGINVGDVRPMEVPLPSRLEQDEIVKQIETAFAKIDRLATEAEKALKLTDRLDERILAKAFAGELVSQDPNDEPASVLLDRIRESRANAPKKTRQRRTKATAMKKDPKDLLLADSAKWPANGVTSEELATRVSMPHTDLRDALFELLGGTKPQLEQVFDKTEERMRLKRVAQ